MLIKLIFLPPWLTKINYLADGRVHEIKLLLVLLVLLVLPLVGNIIIVCMIIRTYGQRFI